mgnify:CR=1 FL=1
MWRIFDLINFFFQDGWSSRAVQGYETYTCHYVDSNFRLQSRVLGTREYSGSHTGEALASMLLDVLEEWQLQGKVVLVTVDNASNMTKALRLANVALRMPCLAHTLNIASERTFNIDLEDWATMLKQIRAIVTHFHKSNKSTEILHEKQRLLERAELKLIMDCGSRWNSTHAMLKRFSEELPAIQLAVATTDLQKKVSLKPIQDRSFSSAIEYVRLMNTVVKATALLSSDSLPTIGCVLPMLNKLKKQFTPEEEDTELTK